MANTKDLKLAFCEDWFIYARDKDGNLYSVCTEIWPEWESIPEADQQRPTAVEDYMLPVARARWNKLDWRLEQLSVDTFCRIFKDVMNEDPKLGREAFKQYPHRQQSLFIEQFADAYLYIRSILGIGDYLRPTMLFSYPTKKEVKS